MKIIAAVLSVIFAVVASFSVLIIAAVIGIDKMGQYLDSLFK